MTPNILSETKDVIKQHKPYQTKPFQYMYVVELHVIEYSMHGQVSIRRFQKLICLHLFTELFHEDSPIVFVSAAIGEKSS